MMDDITLHCGDALTVLRTLPDESVQCCVTSPPYLNMRDYSIAGQIGLESTVGEYILKLVEVFHEVRRVLRADGTLWLNIDCSYAGGGGFAPNAPSTKESISGKSGIAGALRREGVKPSGQFKSKNVIGIPWILALAMQADGWYLRCDCIWYCKNLPILRTGLDK